MGRCALHWVRANSPPLGAGTISLAAECNQVREHAGRRYPENRAATVRPAIGGGAVEIAVTAQDQWLAPIGIGGNRRVSIRGQKEPGRAELSGAPSALPHVGSLQKQYFHHSLPGPWPRTPEYRFGHWSWTVYEPIVRLDRWLFPGRWQVTRADIEKSTGRSWRP